QEPARPGAPYRDVVGVDYESVPAEVLGHEGDGIRAGDQIAVPEVEDGGIFPDAGAQHHALVQGDVLLEQPGQKAAAQLPHRQDLVRAGRRRPRVVHDGSGQRVTGSSPARFGSSVTLVMDTRNLT